jgi:cytochrome oxidase Cu insertion factor (SCO1/SenC/PrrC family)
MLNKHTRTSAFAALTLTTIAIVFLAAACSKGKNPVIGNAAPPFSVPSFTGEALTPEGFKGEPLLIYFFASW